jgi:hypothetical protein
MLSAAEMPLLPVTSDTAPLFSDLPHIAHPTMVAGFGGMQDAFGSFEPETSGFVIEDNQPVPYTTTAELENRPMSYTTMTELENRPTGYTTTAEWEQHSLAHAADENENRPSAYTTTSELENQTAGYMAGELEYYGAPAYFTTAALDNQPVAYTTLPELSRPSAFTTTADPASARAGFVAAGVR